MSRESIIYLSVLAALSASAYRVAADDPIVDARIVVRQARADEPDTEVLARAVARAEPAVVLARMAWLEAGPMVVAGEVAAMHEVITARTPTMGTYQRTAWQYSAGLRNPRRDGTHRLGRAPLTAGWPRIFREQWPRVLAAADDAVAGRIAHGCDASPLEHWGGTYVDRVGIARMLRDGMREAVCPGFSNTFLVRGAP